MFEIHNKYHLIASYFYNFCFFSRSKNTRLRTIPSYWNRKIGINSASTLIFFPTKLSLEKSREKRAKRPNSKFPLQNVNVLSLPSLGDAVSSYRFLLERPVGVLVAPSQTSVLILKGVPLKDLNKNRVLSITHTFFSTTIETGSLLNIFLQRSPTQSGQKLEFFEEFLEFCKISF